MIPGLNTDVRYKGKTFHIQTEDSGPENPVLITHVFLGGTILGTEKQSYEDAVDHEELEDHVRELMRGQHKAMYRALLDGRYDDLARRPKRSPAGAIPLAGKRMGVTVGPSKGQPKRATPPPPPSGVRPPARPPGAQVVKPRSAAPTAATTEELVGAISMEASLDAALGFPTDLTGNHPLPDVMLAYLMEEPGE